MDTDSQFRSELDSSFSQLSDLNDFEEPVKSSKQLSSFSKFKKDQRRTADSVDASDNDSNHGEPELRIKLEEPEPEMDFQKEQTSSPPAAKPQKKRRRRRDVVFKRILRECRRFFQVQLSDLTGFVASKKPRKDDYIYK